jgi:two-component system response regulator YesN
MKILIVEDEVNAREGLANLLGKISDKYNVCGKASNGEEGIILARELKPDLIFADIEMPKLDGLQMIGKIKKENKEALFVILSGYSDFKYAQKGIRLGITEYLLKPMTYSNLKNVMLEIDDKINLRKEMFSMQIGDISEEEILEEAILNRGIYSKNTYEIIKNNIKQGDNLYLFNLYLREQYGDKRELIVKDILSFIEYYKIKNFYYSFIKEYNYLSVLINTPIDFSEFIKMLKYNMLYTLRNNRFSDITVGVINLKNVDEIKNSLNKFKNLAKWPIVLGNDEIIHEELISNLKIKYCNYPIEIENDAMILIKDIDYMKLICLNKRLISYLKNDIYNPMTVIEICCNYVFAILTFLKSCNNDFYNKFKNEGILDNLRNSCTLSEINGYLDSFAITISKCCNDYYDINSFPVRKVINYINNYFNDKITLEEIACRMNITPEHLSRLFTKELGKSFSDYLKTYRIDKAKKMLISDKMKIYEVANKVGYSDSKYFCKVFKEVTGMTPKEYMKFY